MQFKNVYFVTLVETGESENAMQHMQPIFELLTEKLLLLLFDSGHFQSILVQFYNCKICTKILDEL